MPRRARQVVGGVLVVVGLAIFVLMTILLGISGVQAGRDALLGPSLRWGGLVMAVLGALLVLAPVERAA